MTEQALSDIRVLEYGERTAAAYCTKLLAELGAEVVKIEKPFRGDDMRSRGPFAGDIPHIERSIPFLYLNTSKMSVTLEPKTASGRKVFLELVEQADILVENHLPGEMEGLGLDYDTLKEVNPRLIMTSITPFGQTGAHRDYKGYDLTAVHSGVLASVTPAVSLQPEREPLRASPAAGMQAEYQSGAHASFATMIAFWARQTTGVTQHIDVSQQEVMAMCTPIPLLHWSYEKALLTRATRSVTLTRLQPCRDGYILSMTVQQRDWEGLCDMMGNPEWTRDEKFKDMMSRMANIGEMTSRVGEWMMEHDREEIYYEGQARGCPFTATYTPEDVVKSRQLKERGFWIEVDHPETGKVAYAGAPYNLSKTPWQLKRHAPLLGEHNEQVYCRRLGYSKEDLSRMREAGII